MAHSADQEMTLPTEFLTATLQRARRVLAGPHLCDTCQEEVTATGYCFQCAYKLCAVCCDFHRRLQDGGRHVLEELSSMTPQALSEHFQSCCSNHPERSANVYCTSDREVICWACATIYHRGCPEVTPIPGASEELDAMNQISAHLFRQAREVGNRTAVPVTQNHSRENYFNQQRAQVIEMFDDLDRLLKERRQELLEKIRAQRRADTHLHELDDLHDSMESHISLMERVMSVPCDGLLLQMMPEVEARSKELDRRYAEVERMGPPEKPVTLDRRTLTLLTDALSSLGVAERPGATAPSATPATVPSTAPDQAPDSAAAAAAAEGASASFPTTTTPTASSTATVPTTSTSTSSTATAPTTSTSTSSSSIATPSTSTTSRARSGKGGKKKGQNGAKH